MSFCGFNDELDRRFEGHESDVADSSVMAVAEDLVASIATTARRHYAVVALITESRSIPDRRVSCRSRQAPFKARSLNPLPAPNLFETLSLVSIKQVWKTCSFSDNRRQKIADRVPGVPVCNDLDAMGDAANGKRSPGTLAQTPRWLGRGVGASFLLPGSHPMTSVLLAIPAVAVGLLPVAWGG